MINKRFPRSGRAYFHIKFRCFVLELVKDNWGRSNLIDFSVRVLQLDGIHGILQNFNQCILYVETEWTRTLIIIILNVAET